jgi:DNA (cytosine-5)-methyltransferase 1
VNVIDLFAGVGGFSLGAHSAGFSVPLAIDLDKNLTASRPLNFPNSKVLHADLATLDPAAALKAADIKKGGVCGLIGGPPCQGFSYIGARNPRDPRNQLIAHYFRFVRSLQPSFMVLENVPGILVAPFRSVLDIGIDSLGGGYTLVGPLRVDAAKYGAATRRHRVILLAYRKDRVDALTKADIERAQVADPPTVYEAIHDLPSTSRAFIAEDGEYCVRYEREPHQGKNGDYARFARRIPIDGLASSEVRQSFEAGIVTGFKPTAHSAKVLKRFANVSQGAVDGISRCPRLAWDQACPTLRAGTGPDKGSFQSIRPIHPSEHRVISVREAARLQGFPDWFRFHTTQWHSFRMIGNSVSPHLARSILKLLKDRTDR